ncbi:hypothetical protein BN1723_013234 [Verticillium longisporum]|uniref:Uncharacterized protein n=1 Tax=Verticillium longisporum TaxID=100787 RepID=A0A0G4LQS9_VERLO|nr:hypothetical protein BN1723_013234 [Verticillium longisporum]
MALSKQEIEAAIRDAVREVSGINRDNLTVNYIRKFTEEKLNLEEGFFSEPEWKSRSRALIKETAESLDTASQQQESSPAKPKTDPTPAPKPLKNTVDDDDDEEPPKKKKPVARSKARKTAASDEDNGSPPKAKRARKPHKVLDSEPEDDDPEDDFGSDGDNSDDFSQDDSEEEAKPTKKRKAGPAPKKPAKKRKTVPDDEDEKAPVDESSALSDAPPDEDSELSDVMDESPKPKPKAKSKTQPKKAAPVKKATPVKPKKQPAKSPSGENDGDEPAVKSKPDAEDAESSELSDVLDEPPKPKRGAKSKDAAPAKPRAPRKSGAAASDDPDEAEVKKLQSQLVKCGIRKVWGGTEITLATDKYLPVDDGGIPTGGPTAFGKGITGGKAFTLGAEEPDIDDCFVVNEAAGAVPLDTRDSPLTTLVQAYHPESKVHLEVASTEPAFQFYTGKYIDVPAVGGLPARGKRSGFCVEPSRYVNAINVDEWRSQSVLKRGDVYGARIVYRGWSE